VDDEKNQWESKRFTRKPPYSKAAQDPPGKTELMWPRPDHDEKTYQGKWVVGGQTRAHHRS